MTFRIDIQALRGLAVLLVVLHHAKIMPLGAGYLGVDIFFVISGYLITGVVKQGIDQENFGFTEFYFRRAKRLLPAAYVTFLVTTLCSMFLLDARELSDFTTQLIGAVTFTCNIVLWRQTGYFEGAAALKPLLHVWSLSLEEQYYLCLPAALVFVRRRYWVLGASLILISSLALCLILATMKPAAAFYLLPTRAWELAIGSLAALAATKGKNLQTVLAGLFWPAVFALVAIPVMPIGATHPGLDAIIVCIATVVVILRRHEALDANPAPRALAKVGDFSYSLYLVHWPVFAFMNNVYVNEPSSAAHATAVALALVLGYLLYRGVELPVRRAKLRFSGKLLVATVAASLGLALFPFSVTSARTPEVDYAKILSGNHGFGTACDFTEAFTPKIECRNSKQPWFLVWGDSFAMHLVPGIAATTDKGVVQATRSVCGPLIGMAPVDNETHTRSWAKDCVVFNQSVIDYLAATASIKVVVMSSTFAQYLDAPLDSALWGSGREFHSLELVGDRMMEHESRDSRTFDVMLKTVEMIRAMGKRVVIVAPPPAAGFDVGRCLERKSTGRLILGGNGACTIRVVDYHQRQVSVRGYLKRLHDVGIDVLDFSETLCSELECATELNGTFVYRDAGHFSNDGSRAVAKQMALASLLNATAR